MVYIKDIPRRIQAAMASPAYALFQTLENTVSAGTVTSFRHTVDGAEIIWHVCNSGVVRLYEIIVEGFTFRGKNVLRHSRFKDATLQDILSAETEALAYAREQASVIRGVIFPVFADVRERCESQGLKIDMKDGLWLHVAQHLSLRLTPFRYRNRVLVRMWWATKKKAVFGEVKFLLPENVGHEVNNLLLNDLGI